MKKIITFLAMFMFTIMLVTLSVATTYYDQNFNTNICSQLSFSRADTHTSAPSWNYNCSTSSGVLHLYSKNTLVTGFNLTTPLIEQTFWNRNLTYTIILKKSNTYSDFYISPIQMSRNEVYEAHEGCSTAHFSPINLTLRRSMDWANPYSEIVTPSSAFNTSDYVFLLPMKISYPEKAITFAGSVYLYQYYQYGCGNVKASTTDYTTVTNLSGACVDDGCVIQLVWDGIGSKTMKYYVNNALVKTSTFSQSAPAYNQAWNSENVEDTLNYTYGGGIFFSGNDYVDVDIDRIILEEGNTVGNYYWGSSTAPLVDCNDGLDNDLDGLIDYPEDPSCTNSTDTDESPKDASLCEEATCSQADKCIYSTAFECADSIRFHGWNSTPLFYSNIIESDGSKILLNEFLNPTECFISYNGSTYCTNSSYIIQTNYSTNKKDYTETEHKFIFYMQNNAMSGGNLNEWTNLSFIGNSGVVEFTIGLKPVSLSGGNTWIYIYANGINVANATAYADGLSRFELLVKTYKPTNILQLSQFDFFYRSPSFISNTSVWRYSNSRLFFNSSSRYIEKLKISVSGDPAYDGATYDAETYMYLSSIQVSGVFNENDTSTQCTEWSSPYLLKEDFNSCLNNCGWNTVPSSLCTLGSLQSTLPDSIAIAKQNDYIDSTISRYVTLSFDVTSQSFDLLNGVSFQLYDADAKNFIYILLNNHILLNRVDGTYGVLSAVNLGLITNVQIHIDLADDTFDVFIDGVLVSADNKFSDSNFNVETIGSLYIQSSRYAYLLDNVKLYMTDQSNNELIINPNIPPEHTADPTKSLCGYINKVTPVCDVDADCDTGYCTPSKKCSSFDMTYCDDNGYTRGNQCLMSAYASCGMSSIGDIVLGNFLYVLVFILLLVGATYLAVMLRSGKG